MDNRRWDKYSGVEGRKQLLQEFTRILMADSGGNSEPWARKMVQNIYQAGYEHALEVHRAKESSI